MAGDPTGLDVAAAEPAAGPTAKVVERPSPLTGLARAAIALGAGAFFVGRELIEGNGLGGSMLWIGLALLGVALIAGVSGVLTWRTTTFCLLYTSPSPRDRTRSRMPSSA